MDNWLFTAAWLFIIVWFFFWEIPAIVRKERGDTLSEHVWSWFCLRGVKAGKSRWCIIRRVLFFGFWIWLSIHFLSGGAWL